MTLLAELTWPQVPHPRPLLALPLGSAEQHGPHLPLDTDTRVAVAVACGLAARRPDVLVAPPLAYGASGEHAGFPGTLSLGRAALEQVLLELVRSADATASGVLLVNGHGGNAAAVRAAAGRLAYEGRRVLAWSPRPAGGDLHAGRAETSLLLHLAPELVRLERAVAGPRPPLAELVRHGVRALSPSGVLGDPAGASAREGAALLAALVDDLTGAVAAWTAA